MTSGDYPEEGTATTAIPPLVPLAAIPTKEDAEAARAILNTPACQHCGAYHVGGCPRIRRMRFRQDGTSIEEVEFWRSWPAERVRWAEDLHTLIAAYDAAQQDAQEA